MALKYQLFPRSIGINPQLQHLVDCFLIDYCKIDSEKNQLASNEVLEAIREHLEKIDFIVETGKKDAQKIKVPVLFGHNNKIDKFFNADALSKDGTIVIEVEAGRAVTNNQFLKDIFQASMMHGVKTLVLAVRNEYKGNKDYESIYTFLETMYISNRISLPLNSILLIGY
jgi:hypothetical protein